MNQSFPVVIFVYKRLEETKRTFESLMRNPESSNTNVIVFIDGAKNEDEQLEVSKVAEYVSSLNAFQSLKIVQRQINFGLSESFISGISEVLSKYEAAIFLEDDNLLSRDFLKYMNSALNEYLTNGDVLAVTGYSFPLVPKIGKPYFIHGAGTWSMGTWARSWKLFESDAASALLKVERLKLAPKMNMYGIDFYSMLKKQANGKIDSWGVRWWATAILNDMVTLYPGLPLCVNIGGNANGTHTLTPDPILNKEKNLSGHFDLVFPKSVDPKRMILIRFKLMHMTFMFYRVGKKLRRALIRMGKVN
jgi:glycosyltransferase involved in cell wall biosynthesis